MNKKSKNDLNDELRPYYDLHQLLKGATRGQHAQRYRAGTNLVLLDPDIAKAFPTEAAVNETLRLVLQLQQVPGRKKRSPPKARGVSAR